MAFKINVSHNGKTAHFDVDNESFIDMIIGDKINGKEVNAELEGYELEISGSSDKAGFPGFKGEHGPNLRKKLLKLGPGMWDRTKGIKRRKSIRGEQISQDTVQINMIVLKEGHKKFEELVVKEKKE